MILALTLVLASATAVMEIRLGEESKGCGFAISTPVKVARWRAFQNNIAWRQKKGPWGPGKVFTCAALEIPSSVYMVSDYIIFDVGQDRPSICLPLLRECP